MNKGALSKKVRVARHYRRSVRLDADLGRPDALDGYVCHGTAKTVLENVARQVASSDQRAFTWTGPFGGGKSSLAVMFASALLPNAALRKKARGRFDPSILPLFDKAFPVRKGWCVAAVSGSRVGAIAEIAKALNAAKGIMVVDPRKVGASELIAAMNSIALEPGSDGLLLMIDEMGKFLEAAAAGGDDLHFFQELAESAARNSGRFIVIGILHQAFRQYASRLGSEAKDEWAKVQGRFSDIPLVAASDEVVELLARAIESEVPHTWSAKASKTVSEAMRRRRPAIGTGFAERLDACWPLHPAMAALLGPASKRQFGQNERSTFGFLSSSEPFGFRDFIESVQDSTKTWYRPSDYWDFLCANLEPAILASPDGHRWAQAVDAVERVDTRGDSLRTSLIKNIAVIDLFRNGSGLAADTEVLGSLFPDTRKAVLEQALDDLVKWRTAIFRRHIGAWSIFEGSDFDIDAAVAKTRGSMHGLDFDLLSKLAGLHPVVAKRHYQHTGTLRWMDVSICSLSNLPKNIKAQSASGAFGQFILVIPDTDVNQDSIKRNIKKIASGALVGVVPGLPHNHAQIVELGLELLAFSIISETDHEIAGDPVARRELASRISTIRSSLEDALSEAIEGAAWLIGNSWVQGARLSPIASNLAEDIYFASPRFWSELVNRDSLSPNAVKARRDLLHRMLDSEQHEHLGLEGWPAERGLHEILLAKSGLHRMNDHGQWQIIPPIGTDPGKLAPLWVATDKLLGCGEDRVSGPQLFFLWSQPPFGVKAGLWPVLFVAYLLSRRESLAVYKDGMFISRMTDVDIDECLQSPSRLSLRWVAMGDDENVILSGIGEILSKIGHVAPLSVPLEAARGLVGLAFSLPEWVRRTAKLSMEACFLRDSLLRASDPHKLLFIDLPPSIGDGTPDGFLSALEAPLVELSGAYEAMLRSVEKKMYLSLDVGLEDLSLLSKRASIVVGISGNFRLDAFASRLKTYDGSILCLESILSLAANKPPRLWSDADIDAALIEIASWARDFRQVEALASVRDRDPTRDAFAIVVGTAGSAKTLHRSFDVPKSDKPIVEKIAANIVESLKSKMVRPELLLAAIAEASFALVSEEE